MHLITRAKHWLRPANRAKFRLPWILANVGYDVIYTLVMLHVFSRYGITGWIYVTYILVFSLLFAWSTFELVGALVDNSPRKVVRYAVIAAAAFLAPDIYIVAATHDVPVGVWLILGTYICITATATTITVRKKAAAKRVARAHEPGDSGPTTSA